MTIKAYPSVEKVQTGINRYRTIAAALLAGTPTMSPLGITRDLVVDGKWGGKTEAAAEKLVTFGARAGIAACVSTSGNELGRVGPRGVGGCFMGMMLLSGSPLMTSELDELQNAWAEYKGAVVQAAVGGGVHSASDASDLDSGVNDNGVGGSTREPPTILAIISAILLAAGFGVAAIAK